MIEITKDEKCLLERLYPEYKYQRTMKQDSKRHHYYCVEDERLMRTIADTNDKAAEIVEELDKRRALRRARKEYKGGSFDGRKNG